MDQNLSYYRIDKLYESFVSSAGAKGRYFFLFDLNEDVAKWSPEAVKDLGLSGQYVHHQLRTLEEILSKDDIVELEEDLKAIRQSRMTKKETKWRIRDKEGNRISCSVKYFTVKDYVGIPAYLAVAMTSHGVESHTDPTTSLPDQARFLEYLKQLLASGRRAIVLLIGTTNFAEINALYGYTFGNRVIAALAENLRLLSGGRGRLFRGEGTMLLFCSESMSRQEVCRLYDQQKNYAAQLLSVDETRVAVKLSAGVVMVDDPKVDAHAILACAKYAQNRSETEEYGEPVVLKNDYLNHNEKTLKLVNTIRRDVEDDCNHFSIHYQPIMSGADGSFIGSEAFLRWECEPYGQISPGEFLKWMENDVTFSRLGNWIIRRTLADGKEMLRRYPNMMLNVNLAQRQLENPEFKQVLSNLIKRFEIPGQNLCLELTDRCRNMNMEYLKNEVIYLKSCGIQVALDGSCMMDLRLLRALPVDLIKVGRNLIAQLKKNEKDRAIMKAVCSFAKETGIKVCADGVEDAETLALVREYGIYAYQGYVVSQPVPFEEFMKLRLK